MNIAESTIEDLLFIHRDPTAYMTAIQAKHDIGGSTVPRPEEDFVKVEKPLLRCIHLPANGLDWVEVMNLFEIHETFILKDKNMYVQKSCIRHFSIKIVFSIYRDISNNGLE